MYHRGRSYYYLTRQNQWINLGREYPDALAKWADIEGQADTNSGYFQGIIDRYRLYELPDLAPKTQADRTIILDKLEGAFGKMHTEQIKTIHLRQYLDARTAKVAANREIAVLSTLFNRAINWGWTERNPARGLKKNPEKPRDRYITDAELARLKQHADATYQAIIEIAYLTAMRRGDIIAIQLADITDGGLFVQQNKTGHRQRFTWTPKLRAAVNQAKRARKTRNINHLFTSRHGQPISITAFNSAWRRIRDRAGLPDIHFHDIRAKAITDAKNSHGLDYAQALGGHQNQGQTEAYIKAKNITDIRPLG